MNRNKNNYQWYDLGLIASIFTLLTLVIFAHSIFFFSVFTAFKLFILRLITIIFLIFFAFKIYEEKKIILSTNSLFYKGLLGYAFISILNVIISINTHSSLYGTTGRFVGIFTLLNFLILAFFSAQILNNEKIQKKFLHYLIILGAISSIHGLLQYYQVIGDPLAWDQDPTARVFGTFSHSNHYAGFLGTIVVLSLSMFFYTKDKFKKLFPFGVFVLSFWTLTATASRGGLMATLIAIIFFVIIFSCICYKNYKEKNQKLPKIFFGILIATIILISVSSPFIFGKAKNSNIFQRFTVLEQSIKEGYVPDRISWWFSMIEMIKDKPFFGYGLSTFKDVYNQYRRLDYRNPDDLQYEVSPEAGHMEYLTIAATQGIFGLIAYLIPIFYVFYLSFKKLKSSINTENKIFIIGLLSGLIVYMTQVLLSFGVIETMSVFFIILGIAASFTNNEEIKTEIKLSKKLINFLILIIIISSLFLIKLSFREAGTEINLRRIQANTIFDNYQAAINNYEKLIAQNPKDAFYHAQYAEFLVNIADKPDLNNQKEDILKKGVATYEKAINLNPFHPYFYANLAIAAIKLAQYYEAIDNKELTSTYLKTAIIANEEAVKKGPNNPLYLYNLMQIYLVTSQYDKFFEAADKILAMRTDYKDTFSLIIKSSISLGKLDKAKYYLDSARQKYPKNAEYIELQKQYELSI